MLKKILVADDDPAILDAISLILEDAGYDVKTTANGETQKCAEEYMPDVILLDIWMMGIDGRIVCRALKSQETTKHIPIIMISANKDTEEISREAGADDFISKPFEIDYLLDMIKKYTS